MPLRKHLPHADYARLEFEEETADRLFGYCMDHDLGLAGGGHRDSLTVADFAFHVTLVYSSVSHPSFRDASFAVEPLRLLPKRFQIFGAEEPRVVLEFELDSALLALFESYVANFGHRPDFDPYRPHLTFRGSNGAGEADLDGLPLPDFPIVASRVVHEVR